MKLTWTKFESLRDQPTWVRGDWKRGGNTVMHGDRNWAYLEDIFNATAATLNRIEHGDAEYARQYARGAAHYGLIYLKGAW